MVLRSSSLNARVALELHREPMEATDEDDPVRMDDDDDCASESLSRDSDEHEDDDEDDDDDDIIVADEEEDEEEEEVEPPKRVPPPTPPSAAVKDVMKYVTLAKERGDTAWFSKCMEPVWASFPLMKGITTLSCFGVMKEQPETAGNRSNISGIPATRWVSSPRRNGSRMYVNFVEKETELVQLFFLLASFTRPKWKAYKVGPLSHGLHMRIRHCTAPHSPTMAVSQDQSTRDLAETFIAVLHIIQEVEYAS